jgi:hypothetical protein
MQNRYVGDIGDYVKLAILRALCPGRRLGVAWWLFPDSGPPGDGRHIAYLDAPARWRHLDPTLFDALADVVRSDCRQVAALETANLLPGSVYFSEMLRSGATARETRTQREKWFARCQAELQACDLVFLDPDNGLETSRFSPGARSAGKSVSLAELSALRQSGRTLVAYHHHTRRAGGHIAELEYWAARLRACGFDRVDAIRASPYSPRAFFLLDADDTIRGRAAAFAQQWAGLIGWYADCVQPRCIGQTGETEWTAPGAGTQVYAAAREADNAGYDAAPSGARPRDRVETGHQASSLTSGRVLR